MKKDEENKEQKDIQTEEVKKEEYKLQDGVNLNYKVIDNLVKSTKLLDEILNKL